MATPILKATKIPDTQGVGVTDTQTDGGCGVDTTVLLDTEAPMAERYWGLDLGAGDSCGIIAHCHKDPKTGELVIDRTECVTHDTQNQGLCVANQGL